ncbi:hypothetical protein ABRT01_06615 [Lentibacillus sp. L22]|uniref:hypothetical protein n=1 Tax=Lentibacillus sp. L22 TaxID=3163028 RepID=UPI00346585CB
MNKNFVLTLLVLLICFNSWGIYFLQLPFYQEVLMIAGISFVLMSLIKERFIFLYVLSLILSYGFFLILYAFVNKHASSEMQVMYIQSHLLFTSLTLLFWVLLNFIKKMGEENEQLIQKNAQLQKYKEDTSILTVQEFVEQAKWALTASKINRTVTWMVQLEIANRHPEIEMNIQQVIEDISQSLIRKRFDLVTSTDGHIYILLKNADQRYVDEMIDMLYDRMRKKFNLIDPPIIVHAAPVEEEISVGVVEEVQ